jgi:hypothetical protein
MHATCRAAHRGSRDIALLFYDYDTRRGWGVSGTPRPLFTPGKDPVPIVQEAGWAPRAGLERCGKSLPHRGSIPDRPARSQSLYRLRYPAHACCMPKTKNTHTQYVILTAVTLQQWLHNTSQCYVVYILPVSLRTIPVLVVKKEPVLPVASDFSDT